MSFPVRAIYASAASAFCALACSSGAKDAVPFDDGKTGTVTSQQERLPYPAPPYGAGVGAILENFTFLGWQAPKAAGFDSTRLEPIQLADFYDPSGAKHTPFLVITSTALWCSACKAEYQDMKTQAPVYEKKGVAFLGALFEDNGGGPAHPPDLTVWAKTFDVTFPFVLDPELKLGSFFDINATPMEMIVDTRNMQIISLEEGWAATGSGSLWSQLDTLLAQ
jgi:hypothetical protein